MAQNKAFSLGGVGHPCCCTGQCNTTICAVYCGVNVAGVTVTVKTGGGATVATGTTASNGCVVLNIGTAGTYNVTIALTGFTTRTVSKALTCGGMTAVGFLTNTVLSLTDSDRTITLTNTGIGLAIWRGCYVLSTNPPATTAAGTGGGADDCDCPSAGFGAGNCDIRYSLDCGITGGGGVWTLKRFWGACCWSAVCSTPPFTPVYSSTGRQDPTACTGGNETGPTSVGATTQVTLTFPFNVTLSLGSFACGGPSIMDPLAATCTIDV